MGCFAQRSTPKTSVRSLGVGGAAAGVPGAQNSDFRLSMECDECQDPLEMLARAGRRVDADPNGIEEEVVGQKRKGGSKPGKTTCWAKGCMVPACECKRIDKGRHADANFAAKQQGRWPKARRRRRYAPRPPQAPRSKATSGRAPSMCVTAT